MAGDGLIYIPVINKKPHKLMRGLCTADGTVTDMKGQFVQNLIHSERLFGSLLAKPEKNVFHGLALKPLVAQKDGFATDALKYID